MSALGMVHYLVSSRRKRRRQGFQALPRMAEQEACAVAMRVSERAPTKQALRYLLDETKVKKV